MRRLFKVQERVALGEAQECRLCGGHRTRRSFPWVVTWREPVPSKVGENLVKANQHWIEGDTLAMGATTTACERLHRRLSKGAEAALRDLGVAPTHLRSNPHPSTVVGPRAVFHRDDGFPNLLFAVLGVAFTGELVFPNADLRVPFGPGDAVLFDPIQPHGLCADGCDEAGEVPVCCLSTDIQLLPEALAALSLVGAGDDVWDQHTCRVHDAFGRLEVRTKLPVVSCRC